LTDLGECTIKTMNDGFLLIKIRFIYFIAERDLTEHLIRGKLLPVVKALKGIFGE
jgi:hypothetical protein